LGGSSSVELAKRRHLVSVAWLAAKCPSVELLPILKRLLDEELLRLKYLRERVRASEQRDEQELRESRMLHGTAYMDAFMAIVAPETTAMMREYLPEETVMKVQWIKAHEPKRERGGVFGSPEFEGVEDKRAAYAENHAVTCDEAEAMFEMIGLLTADGATEDQKKHALVLAIQAARLPHGDRPEVIFNLLAATPQRQRATFVFNPISSGETVSFDIVKRGNDNLYEEAKKHSWVLSEGYQLKAWLKLLPFTDRPARMLDIVQDLTGHQRDPDFLEEMVKATEFAASPEAEEALFALAEDNPRQQCVAQRRFAPEDAQRREALSRPRVERDDPKRRARRLAYRAGNRRFTERACRAARGSLCDAQGRRSSPPEVFDPRRVRNRRSRQPAVARRA
jgi:hypothetical protein